MSLVEAVYVTNIEADAILVDAEGEPIITWDDLDSSSKTNAIEWGAIYMNDVYDIPVGLTTYTDTLKNVNSILASEYVLRGDLFVVARNAAPAVGLKETEVKANPVGSKKVYDPVFSSRWIDPFPKLTAMMKFEGYALMKASGGIGNATMVRR